MLHMGAHLAHTHDIPLVLLSVVVAVVGSYAALDLAGQVALARGRVRVLWLLGGILALGVGVWAMHFVSMLGLRLPVPVAWDLPVVAVSLAVSVAGSGAGLAMVTRRLPLGGKALTAGCLFVGFAIVGMHFAGMAAMRAAVVESYDPLLTAISAAVAVAFSGAGLWLALRAGPAGGGRLSGEAARGGGGAALLGAAIAGMHYLAMSGTRFLPVGEGGGRAVGAAKAAAVGNATLAWAVGGGALAVFVLALVGSAYGRRLSAGLAEARSLRESERRFRSLARGAPDFTSILETDGTVRYASPSIERVLGYAPEEREGRSTFELVHPDDAQATRRVLFGEAGDAVRNTDARRVEHRYRHKDGSWRWLETVGSDLLSDPGVGGIVATSRDVTRRKEAEEALRESEERYRTVLEQMEDGYFEVDLAGNLAFFNDSACRMLGYPREELMGMNNRGFMGEESAEKVYRHFNRVYRTGEPLKGFDWELTRKDGGRLLVETSVGLMSDRQGRPVGFRGIIRDASERKAAEEALRESEERYRALVENIPAVVYIDGADETNSVIYRSPYVRDVLGYEPEEFLSDPEFWQNLLHPDDRGRVLAENERTNETGEPFRIEYRMYRKDGEAVWLRDEAFLICDGEGRPKFWQGYFVDITDRKEAEARLREAEARYRSLVEQLPVAVYRQEIEHGGAVSYASPQIERITGYTAGEWLADTGLWVGTLHPDDRERVLAEDERTDRTEEPYRVEHRMFRKDGRVLWVRNEAALVRDGEGRPLYWQGLVSDVTERKEAEERYRTMVEGVPAITYVSSQLPGGASRTDYVSPQVEAVLGYAPEEYAADPEFWETVLHPEDRGRVVAEDERTGETGEPFRQEFRMIARDGSVVWLREEGNLVRVEEDGTQVWHGVMFDVTELKRTELALKQSEEQYRRLVETVQEGIAFVDADERITYCNPAYAGVFGLTPEELTGRSLLEFLDEGGRRRAAEQTALRRRGQSSSYELSIVTADGREKVLSASGTPITDANGTFRGAVHAIVDVTERRRAEEALRESEERFRSLVQNASDMISILDPDGTMRYVSPSVERVLGYRQEERVGRDAFGAETHPDDAAVLRGAFAEGLSKPGGVSRPLEFRVRHKDGSWRDLEAVATNRLDHPAVRGIVVNARDVTKRKAYEERLAHRATHDPLTGLPNRRLFVDRLERALSRAGGRAGRVAVLYLDLDDFKDVNDSLGHEAGDELLVAAAGRISGCVRPEDTVARFGGDEFAVLLEDAESAGGASCVAERIGTVLGEPFEVGGRRSFVGASIGIVLADGAQGRPADLLRNADLTMYEAKRGGKARHAVFGPETERRFLLRVELEDSMRRALERGEFAVHYQPVVSLGEGRIVGFEALARWEHPGRGIVRPDEFVPAAEESGLIVPLGRLVLREACRQAREWQDLRPSGGPGPPLLLGVNLAARQLSDPGLVGDVEGALAGVGLDPTCLTLEITEGAVVGDEGRHVDVLERLRALGVRLAIDDFGTGYSSLSYLRRLPVGLLKIDRSFVVGVGDGGDEEDKVLLSGVIGIAHGLGMRVLAEGVEAAEQAAWLREHGCDLAQGFLFSGPLPAEAATEFLRAAAEGDRGGVIPRP